MQLFFLDKIQDKIFLDKKESRHAIRILRKNKGDIISLTDGKGNLYDGEIILADINNCQVQITNISKQEKQHKNYLHIAIAPTKNIDRFEWFLEKSTEIGIDEITPIICERSERKDIKIERSNRILLSAMKQSLKFYLPKLNNITSLQDLLNNQIEAKKKYIAHCHNLKKDKLKPINNKTSCLILIGPEGDFSDKEIKLACKNNFQPVSLSTSRLRTETAGIVATHTINLNC